MEKLKLDPITYWDYIKLDALLELVQPRTDVPDEQVFIIFHQLTELYFKLIHLELEQIIFCRGALTQDCFIQKLKRANTYFSQIFGCLKVMAGSIDRDQFLQFRDSLFPASGFQSAQFRLIQFYSTPLGNLQIPNDNKTEHADMKMEFDSLYWRSGGLSGQQSGNKTLHLFDEKYMEHLQRVVKVCKQKNIWDVYQRNADWLQGEETTKVMKEFDHNANVVWPTMHLKLASGYLQPKGTAIASTGGTNWKDFLHPATRKIMFFPGLWNEEEKENWGKSERTFSNFA